MTLPPRPTPDSPSPSSPSVRALGDATLPLVAILRGLPPSDAAAIAQVLVEAGFELIEVPLNSPQPLASIATIADRFPGCLVGAGTVVSAQQMRSVADAGGRLIVSPHCDATLIAQTVAAGLVALPGVATPSEAFAALRAGTTTMKIFPAEMVTPPILKSWQAVLGEHATFYPVGGITPTTMAAYVAAGASGFGLGSALYRPGDGPDVVAGRAHEFVAAWNACHGRFVT